MQCFKRNKKQWITFLVVLAVVFAVFLAVSPVYAEATPGDKNAGDDGSNWILRVLTNIIWALIKLLGNLLNILVSGIVSFSKYNDFVNSLAVVNGWVIVRDIANMFFIVVLLIIAFGTILGQEEYHYKKLLPKMLILAVLVNFSRTIVGVMIDFSQVIMLTFVNGYQAAAGGNFAAIFQIIDLLQYNQDACKSTASPQGTLSGDQGILIGALLALIFVVISIITTAVILAVLVLRIISLWLLTVLSPIAFLAGTFPQGQKYYTQWWDEFKNNVMVGPMLAFFLWLSLVTVGGGNAAAQLGSAKVSSTDQIQFACTNVGNTDAIISFIIGNMMLLAGVQMAQQMGGAIAGVAGQAKSALRRGTKLAAGLAYKAAKPAVGYGVERLSAATGIEMRPSKWKEAYKHMRETSQLKRQRSIAQKGMQRLQSKSGLVRLLAAGASPIDTLENPMGFLKSAAKGGPSEARDRLLKAQELRTKMMDHQIISRGMGAYSEMQEQDAGHSGAMVKQGKSNLVRSRQQHWKDQGKKAGEAVEEAEGEEKDARKGLDSALGGLSKDDRGKASGLIKDFEKDRKKVEAEFMDNTEEGARIENEEAQINLELEIDTAPLKAQQERLTSRKSELETTGYARTDEEEAEFKDIENKLPQLQIEVDNRTDEHDKKYEEPRQALEKRKKDHDDKTASITDKGDDLYSKFSDALRSISPDVENAHTDVKGAQGEVTKKKMERTRIKVNAEMGGVASGTDAEKKLLSMVQNYRQRQRDAESTSGLDADALAARWLEDRNKGIDMRIRMTAASATGKTLEELRNEIKTTLQDKLAPSDAEALDRAINSSEARAILNKYVRK